MPTPVRVQAIIKTDDAISENYVTNSWCIDCANYPSDSELDEYVVDFDQFYTTMTGFFGNTVAQNGHELKFYDLSQTVPPNYPIAIKTFDLASNPSTDGLPSEVALCLSMQGAKSSGFPQARRRGRIYFGPLHAGTTADGRPTTAVINALAAAADALATGLLASTNSAILSIWSVANAAAVHVNDGWVDNAWDTQRRRGIDRTTRTTFTL